MMKNSIGHTNRKLIVHADTAHPHTAKKTFAVDGAEFDAEGTTSSILTRSGTL
jgi:hypothetical protein